MDKLKMHTPNLADENFKKLAAMFPNAVTETITGYEEDGKPIIERAIDADVLRQEISAQVVEGAQERYQFTWPDKKKSVALANAPIAKTLRLDRDKSVGRDGTEGGINSENIYIEGDNLDALKLLQETYLGKVKMIYIDPPYNTGSDAFVYNDDSSISDEEFSEISGQRDEDGDLLFDIRFNNESNGRFHTDWLNMLYPRLRIAKDLLTDDGVIFISINDCEVENLKKICNEIFGNGNFIASLIWQQRKGGGNDSKYIAVDHEYILVFCKNILRLNSKWRVAQSEDYLSRYKETEPDGTRYYWDTLVRNGLQNPIVISVKTPEGDSITINSQWSQKKVEEGLTNGSVKFTKTAAGWSLHHKVYMKEGQVLRSLLTGYGNNRSAGQDIVSLFDSVLFDYSKPASLIKILLQLCLFDNDIVMDFFSGSATTAHAVMQLNAEDVGNRKFIMVQLPEKTNEKSVAYKAGYNTICEIGEERIRRARKKIKEETGADIDYGFRVFRVDSSNMEDVYYRPAEYVQQKLPELANNIKPDRTPEDLLFQVMLDLGVLLSSKIDEEVIAGKKVFSVENGYLIACFDNDVTEETVMEIAKRHPFYAVFRDSGLASDSVAVNFEQIFETYSPKTHRMVL